jgi:hypothetical protein
MKTQDFKKIIKEAVREAIQEELKDILLEAVRSPRTAVVTEQIQSPITPSAPSIDKRAMMQAIMGDFTPGQDTLSFNSNDVLMTNTLQVRPGMDTIGEGSALPQGNVGLDMIMGLMKGGK